MSNISTNKTDTPQVPEKHIIDPLKHPTEITQQFLKKEFMASKEMVLGIVSISVAIICATIYIYYVNLLFLSPQNRLPAGLADIITGYSEPNLNKVLSMFVMMLTPLTLLDVPSFLVFGVYKIIRALHTIHSISALKLHIQIETIQSKETLDILDQDKPKYKFKLSGSNKIITVNGLKYRTLHRDSQVYTVYTGNNKRPTFIYSVETHRLSTKLSHLARDLTSIARKEPSDEKE